MMKYLSATLVFTLPLLIFSCVFYFIYIRLSIEPSSVTTALLYNLIIYVAFISLFIKKILSLIKDKKYDQLFTYFQIGLTIFITTILASSIAVDIFKAYENSFDGHIYPTSNMLTLEDVFYNATENKNISSNNQENSSNITYIEPNNDFMYYELEPFNYNTEFLLKSPPDRGDFGVLGDFFGGVFNPILSFASLILLLGTFLINLKELKETRVEINKQSNHMEKQTNDTFYFELVKRYDNLLDDVIKKYDDAIRNNLSCWKTRELLNNESIYINYIRQTNELLIFINKNHKDIDYYLNLLAIFQNCKIPTLIAISCYGQESSDAIFNIEHRKLVKSSIIKKNENIFLPSLLEAKKQKPPISDKFIISLLVDYEILVDYEAKTESDRKLIKKSRAIIKLAQTSEQSADDLLSLGCLYYLGEEISEDYEKAFYYFKKSNQLNPNNDITKFWLATCYLKGDGVQKNLNEANALYGQIKDSHNSNTKPRLKELAQKLYQQTKPQEITLSSVGDLDPQDFDSKNFPK